MVIRSLLVAAVVSVCACGDDDVGSDADASPPDAAPPPMQTIFLNSAGGTYTPGSDDSRENVSSIITEEYTVPADSGDDATRAGVLDCVAEKFASFNVTVVDEDPGDADHVEIVMTTVPEVIGIDFMTASLAPFGCDPPLREHGIAFVFVDSTPGVPDRCWTAAAAAGSMFGLDWVLDCGEVQTQLTACSARKFRDEENECGEVEARDCMCGGGATQNTYQLLVERVGLAD